MVSEFDEPNTPPPRVKRFEVMINGITHDPTSKSWEKGDTLLSTDLPEPIIRTYSARGYIKEVKNG